MSVKGEPTHRGTLVCVVLKAKNLPNKKSIGKQDPYCTLQLGTYVQKTKPDKRGGQHPQWDEQLHFEIYDDMEDQLRNTAEGSGSLGASSSIETQKKSQSKTSKSLRVTCYADDAKDPEFIGEGIVDLADTLKSGEFDEWVTIKAKDRYAGEVYLELTFYSAAAPPKKTRPSKPVIPTGTTYGGAGTFSEDIDENEFAPKPTTKDTGHAPIPSYMRPGHPSRPNNSSGMTSSKSHAQLGSLPPVESVPPSLRPSSSMAQLDSYTPPYAPPNIQREKSPGPSDFANSQRRESFPPLHQSASSQLYGHRLQDAAPASMIAQQYQDQSRYSHTLSTSVSYQHIPQASSVSTLRGNQYENPDATLDGLIRPMSSMSMNARPSMAELPPPPMDPHQPQYANISQPGYQPHQVYAAHPPPPPPQQQQQALPPSISVDQFGRPTMTPAPHSYSVLSVNQSGNHFPAPTPPPPSHSAPPGVHPVQAQSQWANSPPSHQSSLPQSSSQLVAPPMQGGRPSSPGVGQHRPHSRSGYHALPQPPEQQQQQQQQQHEYTGYQQPMNSSVEYNNAPQNSYGAPPPARPLPSTSPMQNGGAMVPSPSSGFAVPPGGSLPPSTSYYPPPPQTPSHYVSPPPMMQWSHSQAGSTASSTYSSYPPPPPGPSNGGYVHTVPQGASPSNHPGQYPPPPPLHQMEYSQPYYNQGPPPSHQQQSPPPPSHLNHPTSAPQSYYHQPPPPQQQQQHHHHQQQQPPY